MIILSFLSVLMVAIGTLQSFNEVLVTEAKYKHKSAEAKTFAKANSMNTNYCFLVDMMPHNGKKRFAVWDLKSDTAVREMVVTHGVAGAKGLDYSTASQPVFSNISSSHASSLGKYKIGARSYSSWGINIHYKMHGLEPTNSNAFKRVVVLHSWNAVSQKEVYPNESPYSWGCPAVSNEDMRYLDSLLKVESNVLMWIYHEENMDSI